MDERVEVNLEVYLQEMRTLVRRSDAPSVRVLRRQKLLPALRQHALAQRRRRRRLYFWKGLGVGAMTFGTAAGLVALAVRPSIKPVLPVAVTAPAEVGVEVTRGTVIVNQLGGQRALVAGQDVDLGANDWMETTGNEEAQVRLASIASVKLAEQTRLADIGMRGGQIDRIRLARGSVHLKVTKLAADRRFHIVTPDVDVQVKGTEFDVSLAAEPKPHTCVRVQEGVVQVTAGAAIKLLSAGETWGCSAPVAKPAAALVPAPAARQTARRAHAPLAASELRMQNELFERALGDEHAGLYPQAAEVYQQLLRRYPTGPLAEQAAANLAAMPRDR